MLGVTLGAAEVAPSRCALAITLAVGLNVVVSLQGRDTMRGRQRRHVRALRIVRECRPWIERWKPHRLPWTLQLPTPPSRNPRSASSPLFSDIAVYRRNMNMGQKEEEKAKESGGGYSLMDASHLLSHL